MVETNWTLIDRDNPQAGGDFAVTAADFGRSGQPFSVHKRTLRGGLSAGVEVVEIDNGRFRFVVLPTRGMSIWKGWLADTEVGWQSPVRGPVHPQFVPLMEPGGLGWLDGFDEWIVRCGLESNGAPEFDDRGVLQRPLHGRIGNRPASRVELEIDVEREEIRLTGIVDETRPLVRRLQLRSTVVTRFGEAGLVIDDEVTNLGATPTTMQILYHINFGPPWIDAGAQLIAPAATVVPHNARSAEGIDNWRTYAEPEAGFVEQCYFLDMHAADDKSQVLLRNAQGTLAARLSYDRRQLPCFTLWKRTAALQDGYVTGLEPATNFPNPRAFETKQGRVVNLEPNQSARFDLAMTLHAGTSEVARAEAQIAALAADGAPRIYSAPPPGWSVAGG